MSQPEIVTITVQLTSEEAWQFAQFLKRSYFEMYSAMAEPGPDNLREKQAYTMIRAGGKISEALAEKGYAPR